MSTRKQIGDWGEKYVCEHVPCPNCGRRLQQLPPSYPLADVQCTACAFRAQVKTSRSRPKSTVNGAGWDVVDKVTKSGHLLPSLLVVWAWPQDQPAHVRVDFFPFISRSCLEHYRLSPKARRANYRMFRYRIGALPSAVLREAAL